MAAPKKLLFLLLFLPAALCAKAGAANVGIGKLGIGKLGIGKLSIGKVGIGKLSIGKVEGMLNGYVTDAVTKRPLSGVVVSATVPGTNHQEEVLTDSDGYFRFVELPSAQVTVEFNKKGYQSCKRPNVIIRDKSSVKLNIEFLPQEEDANSPNSEQPVLRLLQAS